MSLKKMAVKMALAFAAAKGVQAFRSAGGLEGVKRKLAESQQGGGGQRGLSGGGIGDMLGQLGLGGAAGAGAARGGGAGLGMAGLGGRGGGTGGGTQSGIGGLLGALAGATAGAQGSERMRGLLDTTRPTPENTPEEEQVSGLMLRAMIFAARADGEIDEAERATLMEVIGDASPEETAFIQRQMTAPVNAETLARDVPEGHEIEVYTASVLAIEPDNRAEAEYLDALARALKIERRTVNEIHEANGKPPLYTI
ncbi:tellurite resistance TerB family protein [Palleronia sediminis]|uniref:Tellurite resistance TerB family protein n=1 Tax=Palleronia sediminis TaxID=2547833 RepID=A0A4R6ADN5_9RHOB|nr:DUF533 domain-containing protein [Palleronia sediminis]TDL79526.1 tellurite resistance TerB family protein [Palleronia sediminis]